MIVTKEQYLEALDVIEKYHSQILIIKEQINQLHKTRVEDWIRTVHVSQRLRNLLLVNLPFMYIEDINKREFLMLRKAGKLTLNELEKLLGWKI